MRQFHVSDNNYMDFNDKKATVRPLLAMINEHSLQRLQRQQDLSIDESTIPYYGRHGAKQFINGNSTHFRFKMWVHATLLGYAVQFEPYQGACVTTRIRNCEKHTHDTSHFRMYVISSKKSRRMYGLR